MSLESQAEDTASEVSKLSTDTVGGRFEIKLAEMLKGMSSVDGAPDDDNTPAIKAIKLMMPMMLRHIRKADDATIAKFSKYIADNLYWVANGEEATNDDSNPTASDASGHQPEENSARVIDGRFGIGEVDASGVPSSTVSIGESESPDSGSGHKAKIHRRVASKRLASVKAVQEVGPRGETPELDVAAELVDAGEESH